MIFVVITVIVGAGQLKLRTEKSVFDHNCPNWRVFHIMNVEKDQLRN